MGLSTEEYIKKYINEHFAEMTIRNCEDQILQTLKILYETHHTEENGEKWDKFAEFIIKRRLGKK